MFDYNMLLGKIKQNGLTQDEFAPKIGTNPSTLSQKLNGKAYFKQVEIKKSCELLNIPVQRIGEYFFKEKV